MAITTAATVRYNGYQFTEMINTELQMEAVYTTPMTSVKYYKYTLTVEATISPHTSLVTDSANPLTEGNLVVGSTINNKVTERSLEAIRWKLMQPNGNLEYIDKGFGRDFSILNTNSKSYRQDVAYGPHPKVLVFETMGSNKAARIVWTVEFRSTECLNSPDFRDKTTEFWVKSQVNFKKNGYQTITRTGYFELMGNRTVSNRNLRKGATDKFRDLTKNLFSGRELPGFHMTSNFDFSGDNRSCNFSIVYEQIESDVAYPTYATDISFRHRLGSKLMSGDKTQAGFMTWLNRASCEIILRPGVPKQVAWVIFTAVVGQRIAADIETIIETQGSQERRIAKIPIILSIDLEDDVYSQKASFNISWMQYTQSMKLVLEKSGIFKSPNLDDNGQRNLWTQDMRSYAQNTNGAYKVDDIGSTDIVIQPCSSKTLKSIPSESLTSPNKPPALAIFEPGCPPPESSFIDYKNTWFLVVDKAEVSHQRYRLSPDINRTKTTGTAPNKNADLSNKTVKVDDEYNKKINLDDFLIQDLGNDRFRLIITGYSLRLGYPTEPPAVVSVGKKPVRLVEDKDQSWISQSILSTNLNCPIYLNKWRKTYEVMGYPSGDITIPKGSQEPGDYGS